MRIAMVVTAATLAMTCDEPRQATPNIFWILAEDVGPELGSYGDPD